MFIIILYNYKLHFMSYYCCGLIKYIIIFFQSLTFVNISRYENKYEKSSREGKCYQRKWHAFHFFYIQWKRMRLKGKFLVRVSFSLFIYNEKSWTRFVMLAAYTGVYVLLSRGVHTYAKKMLVLSFTSYNDKVLTKYSYDASSALTTTSS